MMIPFTRPIPLRFGMQAFQNVHPLLQVFFASLFVALCAQIRIPLPFTPIPLSFQTLSVMLVAGTLGGRKGACSLLLYLFEASIGLPVLAGWRSEPWAFMTPVGGYLFGFVVQAFVTGWMLERFSHRTFGCLLLALSCGSVLQLGLGSVYLANFTAWENTFKLGFYPFIPTEAFKMLAAAFYLHARERAEEKAG